MMFHKKQTVLATAAALAVTAATGAWATNGMNFEGYGSRATAMGGASSAYDSGNSAVMNNPATLGLMDADSHRLGIGLRVLRPDITSSFKEFGLSEDSDGTAYWAPSASYMLRRGDYAYGIAIMAQGGMGTEYGAGSPLFSMGLPWSCSQGRECTPMDMVPMSGQEFRSEVTLGRIMLPLVYNVNDRLSVGGTLEAIWGGMDLRMDIDGNQFGQLMMGNGGSVSGSMLERLGGAFQSGMVTDVNYARFDFTNGSDFFGEAKGYGWAAKLGMTYAVNDRLRLGATYHFETQLDDWDTDNATLSMGVQTPQGTFDVPVSGKLYVRDFQWPASFAFGAAYQATDKLMIVGDVKWINWSDTMDTFKVAFKADNTQDNPMAGGFAGANIDVGLDQNWDDQTVFQIGAEYQYNPKLALRIGANFADNPVPNSTLNPLFPATIENHYTAGFGYDIADDKNIGFSLAYAPEVKETAGNGITIEHSQLNFTFNYQQTF